MNRWRSSSNAGDEPLSSAYPPSGWPTPHTTTSNQPSPSRREHAVQPPPLTTALSGPQFQGLGLALGAGYSSTPLSTTSLSSPFTQGHSPAVASPGGAAIGSSPMASRQYSSMPYNPQDWGPVGNRSINAGQSTYPQPNNMLRIIPQPRSTGAHSDVSLSPPPPPYSPPSQQHQTQQHRDNVSQNTPSMGSTSPSINSSYNGAVRPGVDASLEYRQRRLPRNRPLSMALGNDTGHNRRVSLPPPPPLPQGIPASRSSSQNRVDGYNDPTMVMTGPRPHIVVSPENLRPTQLSNENHMFEVSQSIDMDRPPAARRAVSAGPAVNSASSSRAHSQSGTRSPSGPGWEPGMPLPPPPPGPPPTARSHSVSGLSDALSFRNSQAPVRGSRTRPPPVLGTGLDSIPPTPAGWVDEGTTDAKQKGHRLPLTIDTTNTSSESGPGSLESSRTAQNPNSGGLFRSPAIKDPNAKGIRERRIERRNRQSLVPDSLSAISMSSNPWAEALEHVKPSNLVLEDSGVDSDTTRPQASAKFTPHSSRSIGSDGQQVTSRPRASSGGLFSNRTCSTPKAEPSPLGPSAAFAQTPPFSPGTERSSTLGKRTSPALPTKALPTPPLQSGQDKTPSRSGSKDERPISHILHLPNDTVTTVSPLAPRRVSTQQGPSLDTVVNRDDEFVRNAVQRHQEFIEKEADTVDEKEALRLFADFIITESQIRRERYAKAWDSNSFDVEDVRRRLFECPPKPVLEQPTSQIAYVPASRRIAKPGAPKLDIPQTRPESAWWNNYKPCLSPIASLGLSNDEMSSRGRAPSRWWESKTGSSSEGGERRMQRSKRETKYMGLPRGALQWEESQASSETGTGGASNATNPYAAYGPDEYPPEKVGWHEEPTLPEYSRTMGRGNSRRPEQKAKMDVSRLVTLPPPYPRHYPAVNNSHPDLVSYRTLVRSITDLSEIKATRQRHQTEMDDLFQDHKERVKESRRQFKANIQNQIQQGSITFAEAAEAEAALVVEENRLEKELTKRGLDAYQESVLKPMRMILTDRIDRASTCIDELRSRLFDDARSGTPDQTQEEGDEKPELLEKLTQVKWLFEAREQLHREMFDLVSDRDEKYRAVVLLPYKQAANEEKVGETNDFFVKDGLDRRVNYEASALARLETFLDVTEENVARGVEVQLSAFWDIAPSLYTLVHQIPENIRGFLVQIPANEYDENPSYHEYPLQYLYTLVSHAEKSSYQYIESQINLFCLLHEVKSAVMRASCKLMEAERICLGEAEDKVKQEMQESRADEERTLTSDLKDKVATVEGQWAEALGSEIERLRERVKEQLMAEDGWEGLEQLEQA